MKKSMLIFAFTLLCASVTALEYCVPDTQYGQPYARRAVGGTPIPTNAVWPIPLALKAVSQGYLKIVTNSVQEKSQGEKDAWDAAVASNTVLPLVVGGDGVVTPPSTNVSLGSPSVPFAKVEGLEVQVGDEEITEDTVKQTHLTGKQACRVTIGSDISTDSNDYVVVNSGSFNVDMTNLTDCSLLVSVSASVSVTAGESVSLTVYVDGTNVVSGETPVIYTEISDIHPVEKTFVFPSLAAGSHTLNLYWKVSGGTGILHGTKAPVEMGIVSLKGTL